MLVSASDPTSGTLLRVLRGVDRILYRVDSVAAALRYWRDVLGLQLVHESATLAVLRFADGGSEIVLHNQRDLPDEAVFYAVDDVRAIYEQRELLRLTFASPPVQASRGFRATARDPFGNVLLLIDRSLEHGARGAGVEDGKAPAGLFDGVELQIQPKRSLLIELYTLTNRTADDLPYTPHFEGIYAGYIRHLPEPHPSRAEVWRHLLNLRKSAKLPKLGEARTPSPEVDDQTKQRLRDLLGDDIGRRDRLPYTPRFDEIADAFSKHLPRPMPPHLLWRLIATLAK